MIHLDDSLYIFMVGKGAPMFDHEDYMHPLAENLIVIYY